MPWFYVDDQLCTHPKAMQAGNAALGLWVRSGSWSMQQLTDGEIPTQMVRMLGTTAQAKSLVSAGLWTPEGAGYQFHEWQEWQETSEKVKARREANRQRVKRWRSGVSNGVGNGVTNSVGNGASARSQSQSQSQSVVKSRSRPTETLGLDDDDLDRIEKLTRGGHDHASRVAADILGRANGDVTNRLGYVLRAIGEEPARYRSSRGPDPGDECPEHPGQHRDHCGPCAADRKASL